MKRILFLITLGLTVLFTGCQSSKPISAEKQAKIAEISNKLRNFDFTFVPTTIRPMHGRTLQLMGGYSLNVSSDQLRAYIPYIGRAYVMPTNPMNIGVDFKTDNFEYSNVQNKNGSYDIRITPNGLPNIEDRGMILNLNVNSFGYGTLNIQFANRQSVSYSGYIE